MFIKYLAKLYLTVNDPLPVLLGNGQDLGHENLVNSTTDPIFNQYNSVRSGRMIYFRESSNSFCYTEFVRWRLKTPIVTLGVF